MLETLNKEFIKRVLEKILAKLKSEKTEAERLALINTLDEKGASLLHYVTALNYYDLISLLVEFGADINVKCVNNNVTPLMIACAKGHEKSVKKLVRLGAEFWNQE